MRLIVLVLLALVAGTTLAETLSWTPPTTRADGTPLDPATEISEYRLACGEVVTSIDPTVQPGSQYEYSKHEILPNYGRHECHLVAVDTDGLVSDASDSVTIQWEQAPPAIPTDVILITE